MNSSQRDRLRRLLDDAALDGKDAVDNKCGGCRAALSHLFRYKTHKENYGSTGDPFLFYGDRSDEVSEFKEE